MGRHDNERVLVGRRGFDNCFSGTASPTTGRRFDSAERFGNLAEILRAVARVVFDQLVEKQPFGGRYIAGNFAQIDDTEQFHGDRQSARQRSDQRQRAFGCR